MTMASNVLTPMISHRAVTHQRNGNKGKDNDWPLWFDTKAVAVRSPRSGRRLTMFGLRAQRSSRTVSRVVRNPKEASMTRRAATLALVVCASGADRESKATTDAQAQAKAIAEAQVVEKESCVNLHR